MLHALTFSLIEQLKKIENVTEVVWVYDGVTLTGKPRPLVTVEQMPSDFTLQDKSKDYFEETYLFQVGLRANTASERSRVGEQLKTVLREPEIPFYDTTQASPVPAGFFRAAVMSEVPMPADDIASDTDKHRVYYDVEVTIYRANGAIIFD